MDFSDITLTYDYRKDKPVTVVFLNDWSNDSKVWEPFRDMISKGYSTLTFDYPQITSLWEMQDFVKFAEHVLDTLQIRDVVLVGFAFGGKVAAMLAANHKKSGLLVNRMCLIAPEGVLVKEKIRTRIMRKLFRVGRDGLSDIKPDAQPVWYNMFNVAEEAMTANKESFFKVRETAVKPHLRKVEVPTKIIWGSDDRKVSNDEIIKWASSLIWSDIITIREAGHNCLTTHTDTVLAILETFLGLGRREIKNCY